MSRYAVAAATALAVLTALAAPATASPASRLATPRLHVSNSAAGTSLTWSSGAASRFSVEQATNRSFSSGTHHYSIRDDSHQFTPYGLSKGHTYYFRIRALKGSSTSRYSNSVKATVSSAQQAVRVMTYNVLEADSTGNKENGNTIASWSQRRAGVAALIKQGAPDVVGLEEAAAWVAQVKGPRQVDDIVTELGGEYSLADTEVPPTQHHYFRTGVYILYRAATYKAVGSGGHWDVGNKRWAAYQVLQNRQTGARFLFVNVHLMVGGGSTDDHARAAETRTLLHDGNGLAAAKRLPVVYAGDFNSHVAGGVGYDGPGITMRAAHVADAFFTATSVSEARYDSANGYQRKPPAFGHSIDHIYAPPGVAVHSWGQVINLTNGRFVGTIPSDHNPVVATLAYRY